VVLAMVAAGIAGGLVPATACASTVTAVEAGLVVIEGTASDDVVTASTPDPTSWSESMRLDVEDPAGATAGEGCTQETPTRVSCADVVMVLVGGGPGDDTLTVDDGMIWTEVYGDQGADDLTGGDYLEGDDGPDHLTGGEGVGNLYGGDGDDVLRGGPGSWYTLHGEAGDDVLVGGPGDDSLDGGEGDDHLRGEEPGAATAALSGADWFEGGPGLDLVTYEGRADALTLSIDAPTSDDSLDDYEEWEPDGAPAEGDEIGSDVEGLRGGSGDDHLSGNAAANRLSGGPGSDTIDGGGGADLLGAAAFADDGEPGDDWILARDGVSDTVGCGSGADVAQLDPLDVLGALAAADPGCEQVTVAIPDPPVPASGDGDGEPTGTGGTGTGGTGNSGTGTGTGGGPRPNPWPAILNPPNRRDPAQLVLRRRRALGHGRARVTAYVIPRGTMTAIAAARIDGRTFVVARGRAVAGGERAVSVTLRPTSAGRRALRRRSSLTVALQLRVVPRGATRILTLPGGAFHLRR
jgi:hypothetical protein